MTQADLQKIISILEGPIPGPKATQKEIHDQSVQYHKCAGSLLDEVRRLRAAIVLHHVEHPFSWIDPTDENLWAMLNEKPEGGKS